MTYGSNPPQGALAGMVMHQRPKTPMHVGLIGLGAGTLAAYGRAGDRYQFYEIDPDVIRVDSARG